MQSRLTAPAMVLKPQRFDPVDALLSRLPPLEEAPESLLSQAQRLRMWRMDIRTYLEHPALLRDAIEWREEELAKHRTEAGYAQLRGQVKRLRALADLMGGIAPHRPWGPGA